MLVQYRKWCQAEPEATKSMRSGHQQPQPSLLWISTKIWERVQKMYFRKCSYIREEWLFSWFGIPCALKQSTLSRFILFDAKFCPVDVRVKRGSAQQDKGCFVALLALSWFRVLVQLYEPSYFWGNSVNPVNAGKRYLALSDC